MYAQEEALWGGAPPFKNYFIGRASSGRDRNLRSKTDSQHSGSLSLLANRALLEHIELIAFNTWAESRTLNQHLVKSLKKPLKV